MRYSSDGTLLMAKALLDQYINAYEQLRIGKLMEDLDAHAGVVANLHAAPKDAKEGEYLHPAIVTASVDRIIMLGTLSELVDYEISGCTTWAGRSSMEVSLDLARLPERSPILKANFTMVARDPVTKKAIAVNPLIAETDEEKRIFRRAEGTARLAPV
jgi:acyl-coenzyme A thioesterase 9